MAEDAFNVDSCSYGTNVSAPKINTRELSTHRELRGNCEPCVIVVEIFHASHATMDVLMRRRVIQRIRMYRFGASSVSLRATGYCGVCGAAKWLWQWLSHVGMVGEGASGVASAAHCCCYPCRRWCCRRCCCKVQQGEA